MKPIQWLAQLVQGTDGSPSTMRVGVLVTLCCVMFNWVYMTVHTGQAQQLDWQQVSVILGSLGFKAVQTKFEKPAAGDATPATPANPTKTL